MSDLPNVPKSVSSPPRSASPSFGTYKRPADPLTQPLTDPADLFTLLGRFVASGLLFMITIAFLINSEPDKRYYAIPFALVTLLVQFVAIRMWRRLRDERIVAKQARAEALAAREAMTKEVL